MTKRVHEELRAGVIGVAWCLAMMGSNAFAVAGQEVAYFPAEWGYTGATLVNWDVAPGRALVLSTIGRHPGSYVADDKGRTVTYDQAKHIANYSSHYDSCSQFVRTSYTSTRIRFKLSEGAAEVGKSLITEDAREVVEEGCDKGLVVSAYSVDEPSTYGYSHMLMSYRQGQAGLKAGDSIAGMQSDPITDGVDYMVPDDIATLVSGRGLAFADAGRTISYRVDKQGWWVLNLPSGERAYTRMQTDSQGGQVWLMADLVNGKKMWVQKALMTSAKPSSKFGSAEVAARNWEAGFTLISPDYGFFTRLRADGSGERVNVDRVTGEEVGAPLNAWSLDAGKVVQDIRVPGGAYKRYRTWQSVNKVGDVRWVLEDDRSVYPDGSPGPFNIAKRLHPQVDRGLPPETAPRATRAALETSNRTGSPEVRGYPRRVSPL